MKQKAKDLQKRIMDLTGCDAMYEVALGQIQIHNPSKEKIWHAIKMLKHMGELKFEGCERKMDGEYIAVFHLAA